MHILRAICRTAALLASAGAPAAEVGQPAPPFEAKLLDGHTFSSTGSGQVVLVNFWATWCQPCRAEMPALDAYYRKHRDEGLKIVAVSMDDPADDAKVREVMRAYAFSAAFARDARFKGYGRIWRIPLTFVVDRRGVLRKDGWFGEAGIDEASLERDVTPLLKAPAP